MSSTTLYVVCLVKGVKMNLIPERIIERFKFKMQRYANENKRVFIYGAGTHTKELLKFIPENKIIIGIGKGENLECSDKDLMGHRLFNDGEIKNQKFDKIIISTNKNVEEIVRARLLNELKIPAESIVSLYQHSDPLFDQVEKIVVDINQYIQQKKIKPKIRILWSPSFNICTFFWMHDPVMASALKVRGAEIIPIVCDGIKQHECTVWGGYWVSDKQGVCKPFSQEFHMQQNMNCESCRKYDQKVWTDVFGAAPLKISQYITKKDIKAVKEELKKIKKDNWQDFIYDKMNIGKIVAKEVKNKYLLGYLEGSSLEFRSAKNYLYNCLLLEIAYKKIIEEQSPDIVISHDSNYSVWDILCQLAERKKIPYYDYYMGSRGDGSVLYIQDQTAVNGDISETWRTWKKTTLTEQQNKRLDQFIEMMDGGALFKLKDTIARENTEELNCLLNRMDLSKPIALWGANISWDCAALDKDIFFDNMYKGVNETIKWFQKNPQYQLLIKAHPFEKNKSIPDAGHTLVNEITKIIKNIPKNVFIIPSGSTIKTSQLMQYCKMAIVHTSTMGLDFALRGKPALTTADSHYRNKGFTFDPENKAEYFLQLKRILDSRESPAAIKKRIELSRKYSYLYFFRYYIHSNIFLWNYQGLHKLNLKSYKELLPGNNKFFDYLCDSIINKLKIFSERRMPPEGEFNF